MYMVCIVWFVLTLSDSNWMWTKAKIIYVVHLNNYAHDKKKLLSTANAMRQLQLLLLSLHYYWNYIVAAATIMTTYLHAGSPTSLKKTQVPPFKQNAFPITGHVEPECVQFICWLECPTKKNETNIKIEKQKELKYFGECWTVEGSSRKLKNFIYNF